MSVLDRFLNMMRLNSDDDEDYYNGAYDNEDETPPKRVKVRKKEYEAKREDRAFKPVKDKVVRTAPKALPMRSAKRQGGAMEVVVIKPTAFADAREISETLLEGRTVVINLEGADERLSQRIIDFVSGSCHAIGGNLQRISNNIFVVTPPDVELSGDFLNGIDTMDIPPLQTEFSGGV